MTQAGFTTVSNEYVVRETVNRKENLCAQRIFLQAKFQKHGILDTEQTIGDSIEETFDVIGNKSKQLDIKEDAENVR